MRLTITVTVFCFVCVLCLINVNLAHAESPTDQDHDIIVLKSGGVARGKILTTVEGKHLVLEVSNGKTVKIDLEDIDHITNNEAYIPPERTSILKVDATHPTGVRFLVQGSVLTTKNTTNHGSSLLFGRFFERSVMLNVGLHLDWYAENIMSLRGHVFLFSHPANEFGYTYSLYLHGSAGYGRVVNGLPEGVEASGFSASIGVGFMVPTQVGPALLVELGYHHQSLEFVGFGEAEKTFTLFSLGLCF